MDHIQPPTPPAIPALPARPADGHKGTFGRVAIVAGSAGSMPGHPRMIGAAVLAARGAIRAGCGLVRIATPESILDEVLAQSPFATGYGLAVGADADLIAHQGAPILDHLIASNDALVIGPGLGTGEGITKLTLRAVLQEDIPVVVDADALNALSTLPDFAQDLRANAILTPHPGEAQRLCTTLGIDANPSGTDDQRSEACTHIARLLGCVVVLKGARTVVTDGHQIWISARGHPCMGVGGTGDVLAGIIGSLLAEYTSAGALDLFQCAIVGVHAHAIAGERWAASNDATGGMIATELADKIPAVLQQLRETKP